MSDVQGAAEAAVARPTPLPEADQRVKVLYIVASQRGGSTIVGRVLGLLPGVAFAGEVRRLWERGVGPDRTCGCGLRLAECPIWSKVLVGVEAAGIEPGEVPILQREVAPVRHSWRLTRRLLAARERPDPRLQRYALAMSRTFAALAEAYRAEVVIDASKLPGDAAILAGAPGVDPYYLQLVRDPRGVLSSELRRRSDGGSNRLAGAMEGLGAWALRQDTARQLRSGFPQAKVLHLRYEDFVADPSAATGKVAAFLGRPRPSSLPPTLELPLVHTPGGPVPARAVELREDVRWRRELSRPERALVTALTSPWLIRHGYVRRGANRRVAG